MLLLTITHCVYIALAPYFASMRTTQLSSHTQHPDDCISVHLVTSTAHKQEYCTRLEYDQFASLTKHKMRAFFSNTLHQAEMSTKKSGCFAVRPSVRAQPALIQIFREISIVVACSRLRLVGKLYFASQD